MTLINKPVSSDFLSLHNGITHLNIEECLLMKRDVELL